MSSGSQESDIEGASLPTYNQQEIITALRDFYIFLSPLPYIPPAAILTPPSTGWPNITPENFSTLRKNDNVISLLKHLPYIAQTADQYVIAPDTYPTDYRGQPFQHEVTVESAGRCLPLGDVEFPEWVVNLTHGSRDGTYLMLDTTDGTVTEYNIQDTPEERYSEIDPRKWRNECEGEARPLAELLAEWKDKYFRLEWMGHAQNGWPTVMWADPGDENYGEVKVSEEFLELTECDCTCELTEALKQMRKIMRNYGWPDDFDREGCRRALADWDASL
jgi:hypothetical protein